MNEGELMLNRVWDGQRGSECRVVLALSDPYSGIGRVLSVHGHSAAITAINSVADTIDRDSTSNYFAAHVRGALAEGFASNIEHLDLSMLGGAMVKHFELPASISFEAYRDAPVTRATNTEQPVSEERFAAALHAPEYVAAQRVPTAWRAWLMFNESQAVECWLLQPEADRGMLRSKLSFLLRQLNESSAGSAPAALVEVSCSDYSSGRLLQGRSSDIWVHDLLGYEQVDLAHTPWAERQALLDQFLGERPGLAGARLRRALPVGALAPQLDWSELSLYDSRGDIEHGPLVLADDPEPTAA